jgi:hypothetical protein
VVTPYWNALQLEIERHKDNLRQVNLMSVFDVVPLQPSIFDLPPERPEPKSQEKSSASAPTAPAPGGGKVA